MVIKNGGSIEKSVTSVRIRKTGNQPQGEGINN